MNRPFAQVDVFSEQPLGGNPVAVVLDAAGLDDVELQRFANWTNLSETTFVLPPTEPDADYRVRIFTPDVELPFAGHPTLGTCHAWLEHGGRPRRPDRVIQECGAGLIEIRTGERLAFAAPPRTRSGPVDEDTLDRATAALGLDRSEVIDAEWLVNGPEWVGLLLGDAQRVLDIVPRGPLDLDVGVAAPGGNADLEVRAFFPQAGMAVEDPVTGSLNAGLAQWLLASGRATAPYVAAQGTALGRAGRVHVDTEGEAIWIGGATSTRIAGDLAI